MVKRRQMVSHLAYGSGMHSINRGARIDHNHPPSVNDKRDESAPVGEVMHAQPGACGTPTPKGEACGTHAPNEGNLGVTNYAYEIYEVAGVRDLQRVA